MTEYTPDHTRIFVFGSNLAGRHFSGAAEFARLNHGARIGIGYGLEGTSFGIPTKDFDVKTLPLPTIKIFVKLFIYYAKKHPELRFNVTRVGCGLAGYTDAEIGPMFRDAPPNCDLPKQWTRIFAADCDNPNHPFDGADCEDR